MNGDPGVQPIEKIMSIRPDEFAAGIARLNGGTALAATAGTYDLPVSDGRDGVARITFLKLPTAVLGGLMKLPRARVLIDMSGLDPAARENFLAMFDRTFQRGGG